jgi:hypothetical protein
MSYDVSQRRREIGIRIALGAEPHSVLALVLGAGLKMAALGIVAGALIAFGFARAADGLLFGVTPYDPLTYVGLATILLGLAVAAAYSGTPCHRTGAARFASRMKLQIADFRLQIGICNQSEIRNLKSAISAASLGIVWICLRFWMARRWIATPSRMRLAGAVRNTRAQRYLSFAYFLNQKRNEQRHGERNGDENAERHNLTSAN